MLLPLVSKWDLTVENNVQQWPQTMTIFLWKSHIKYMLCAVYCRGSHYCTEISLCGDVLLLTLRLVVVWLFWLVVWCIVGTLCGNGQSNCIVQTTPIHLTDASLWLFTIMLIDVVCVCCTVFIWHALADCFYLEPEYTLQWEMASHTALAKK